MKLHLIIPFLFALAVCASEPKAVYIVGLENVFLLTERVISGGTPEGEAGFAALRELGVKTIVSVDGAPPDAEGARKFGLRTIHLPIGYDGVSAARQLQLVKVAQSVDEPIYVHCHHGKHRGPTAAAIICAGISHWSPKQATDWLETAGTARDYAGLYAAVSDFKTPSAEQLRAASAEFPERVKVSGHADAMVQLDEQFEQLKLAQKFAWSAPSAQSERVALLLRESFRELVRRDDSKAKGADFLSSLVVSEALAAKLHQSLVDADSAKANVAMRDMTQQCTRCHKQFRD